MKNRAMMHEPPPEAPPSSEIVLYETEDGRNRVEVRLERETVWLTLNQMADLFQVDKSGISRHLRNAYATGELGRKATAAKYATVQEEGGRRVSRSLEAEQATGKRYLDDLGRPPKR